jgi:plasmid stabilization system protein ParE
VRARLHPLAHQELAQILSAVADLNVPAATRLADDFLAMFDLIATMPGRGSRRLDLTDQGDVRFVRVRDYLVAYRAEVILLIVHAARDLHGLLPHLLSERE